MRDASPDALDFGVVLRSLLRGWRWIGGAFVLAALTTAAVLYSTPVRYQSTLELRLAISQEPLLTAYGLNLGSGDVISLLVSSETRQAAVSLDTSPAVADPNGWTADQVTAVGNGQDAIFVIARDENPEMAAATATAVEEAARQVRSARLQQGLREVLLKLEREHEALFAVLEEFDGKDGRFQSAGGSLGDTLHDLRVESTMKGVVALERQIARVHRMVADPPRDWRVVEKASPEQHALRENNATKTLVAVLVPTLLAAIAWLIHDGRPRRR